MNPFLGSLRPIWDAPTCVFLNEDTIYQVASQVAKEDMPTPSWRESVFPLEDDDSFVDFVGVGNSINFAYKDFATRESFSATYEGRNWPGAFGMWACLRRAVARGLSICDGNLLRELTMPQCEEIFAGNMRMPLLDERLAILRQIGDVLAANYRGHFSNLFEEAGHKAFGKGGIVDRLISQFSSFRDEGLHAPSSKILEFHKRAQLFPMMYQGRASSLRRLPSLVDFQDLGPIADYVIPRNLHAAGILRYSPELESRIMNWRLIEKDSVEEQEIRAQTTHAQARLLEEINKRRADPINVLQLDFKLWAMYSKVKEPHHLTRTTAY